MYQFLFEHLLSVILGIYPGVELVDPIVNRVILCLIILRNHHMVSHSDCMILCSYQPCERVAVSHPHQPLLFSTLLIIAIVGGVTCYPIVLFFACIVTPISSVTYPARFSYWGDGKSWGRHGERKKTVGVSYPQQLLLAGCEARVYNQGLVPAVPGIGTLQDVLERKDAKF